MKILVVNCGSSSLKYEVYNMPERISAGKGLIERIGLSDGIITQQVGCNKISETTEIPNHTVAFELMTKFLMDPKSPVIESVKEIDGIGHRVVHGGEQYSASVLIDDNVIDAIEKNIELAPLHNPANLTGIRESALAFP